eukprot:6178835-Pleurochrysis_carterae.AAC.1
MPAAFRNQHGHRTFRKVNGSVSSHEHYIDFFGNACSLVHCAACNRHASVRRKTSLACPCPPPPNVPDCRYAWLD